MKKQQVKKLAKKKAAIKKSPAKKAVKPIYIDKPDKIKYWAIVNKKHIVKEVLESQSFIEEMRKAYKGKFVIEITEKDFGVINEKVKNGKKIEILFKEIGFAERHKSKRKH